MNLFLSYIIVNEFFTSFFFITKIVKLFLNFNNILIFLQQTILRYEIFAMKVHIIRAKLFLFFVQITGAEYERYQKNVKSKSYKIDGNTIKVYGEDVPIKEGKVKKIRDSIESKAHLNNNNLESTEIKAPKITTTEYQGTKELQEIVNSLRQILERKAPVADDELNEVIERLNANSKYVANK